MNMQAVILAAGEGRRLHPFTKRVPKPMIDVQGRPILEYVLMALPPAVLEVVLVVGYKEETIKNYFGSVFSEKKIIYVSGVEPRGTGYALKQARPFITSKYFFLLNGDDLYHPLDLKEASLLERPTVFVIHSRNPERFGVCLTKEPGILSGIIEKPKNPPSTLVNTGCYILNHDIFNIPIPALSNGELNLAEQVGNWARTRAVYTHTACFWNPINIPEELEVARKLDLGTLFPDLA